MILSILSIVFSALAIGLAVRDAAFIAQGAAVAHATIRDLAVDFSVVGQLDSTLKGTRLAAASSLPAWLVFAALAATFRWLAALRAAASRWWLRSIASGMMIGGLSWAIYQFAVDGVAAPVGSQVDLGAHGNEHLAVLEHLPAALLVIVAGLIVHLAAGIGARTRDFSEPSANDGPTAQSATRRQGESELSAALRSCRGILVSVAVFSGIINILMLTGAFYMLEVYDRVLPSHSMATLIALSILLVILMSCQSVLDLIRSRILIRVGGAFDEAVSQRIYGIVAAMPLRTREAGDGLEPIRDLDTVRSFVSGPGPVALFDLPWMPVYLVIIFAFHPWLGWTALLGAVVLVILALIPAFLTRAPTQVAARSAMLRNGIAGASRRNAEVVAAMGMAPYLSNRWDQANKDFVGHQQRISDITGDFGAVSKALRMMLQSAVLGVGAYLVIIQQASAGIIIAGAILVGRALAPVDMAIANWRGLIAARQSWSRLERLLSSLPADSDTMELPPPSKVLAVENVSVVAPGTRDLIVKGVSFQLAAGEGLGIIGPSASGKSTLARSLVGVWPCVQGKVRLDGAALDQWSDASRGAHVGYLPQDVELFAGTIAQNISRFMPNATSEAIVAAARAAGTHELVVRLQHGYETEIGEMGMALSAGQRQRIALARALFGNPFLVVLDEPNSNLDAEGEAALAQAIISVRRRGGIVVVVAHRPAALAGVDKVLTMRGGQVVDQGPKDEVLSRVTRPRPGLKVVAETDKTP